jgi:hypothetical protein
LPDTGAADDFVDLHLDQVTATKLAVDRKIKQRSIPNTTSLLKPKSG